MTAARLLLDENMGPTEVARLLGVTRSAVQKWQATLRRKGLDGLKGKPHRGPKPRLSRQQCRQLLRMLRRGACEAGYLTDLWTCGRVAELIKQQFGVSYHPAHVWKLLTKHKWSCQKPEQQAREADDAEIERWRREEWPRIKKGPAS